MKLLIYKLLVYFLFLSDLENSSSLFATNFAHHIPNERPRARDKVETTHINIMSMNSPAISIWLRAASTVNVMIIYFATHASKSADFGSAIFSVLFKNEAVVLAKLNHTRTISRATTMRGRNAMMESKKSQM